MFRADRLKTMRMRLSAAYKGVNALLMKEGAQDFRSGQKFDHTVFFPTTCLHDVPGVVADAFDGSGGRQGQAGACGVGKVRAGIRRAAIV
jgi:hypothetical protein